MKLAVLMLIVAGLVVVGATPAFACSCLPSSPAEVAARSDAAFVGTYLGRTEPPPGPVLNTSTDVVNHFSMERVVKGGPIAGNVDVRAPYSGASCGLEIGVGQRVGLGLTGSAAEWRSLLCNQTDPDGLLAVGQAVNPPTLPPAPSPVAPSPKATQRSSVEPTDLVATPTALETSSPSPSPTASPTNDQVGLASEEGSGPSLVPILAVGALLLVGVAGALALRWRNRPGPE